MMMRSAWIRPIRDERGVALIEFVFILPIFMLLIFAGTEFGRYLLIALKVQNASYTMASAISQYDPATQQNAATLQPNEIGLEKLTSSLDGAALTKMMEPFGDRAKQALIITSIRRETGVKRVKWQLRLSGDLGGITSRVTGRAVAGPGAFIKNLPTSFDAATETQLASMLDGENLIVAEVFFDYQPLTRFVLGNIDTNTILPAGIIRRMTLLRPRNGDLICLPSGVFPAAFIYSTDCP